MDYTCRHALDKRDHHIPEGFTTKRLEKEYDGAAYETIRRFVRKGVELGLLENITIGKPYFRKTGPQ